MICRHTGVNPNPIARSERYSVADLAQGLNELGEARALRSPHHGPVGTRPHTSPDAGCCFQKLSTIGHVASMKKAPAYEP